MTLVVVVTLVTVNVVVVDIAVSKALRVLRLKSMFAEDSVMGRVEFKLRWVPVVPVRAEMEDSLAGRTVVVGSGYSPAAISEAFMCSTKYKSSP